MNLSRLLSLAGLAFFTLSAMAAEPYVGLSLTTPGEARIVGPGKATLSNQNHPPAFKLYGGLTLDEHWSLEAGYGAFGSWHFADAASFKARLSARAVTVAGRYTLALNESFAVFTKLGLAANQLRYTASDGGAASDHFVRPMWGFGAEWRLGRQLSVPLEYEHLGRAHTQVGDFRQQKLELGLRYRF